jgi:DNA-binding NtrC family response regulator
MAAVVKRDPIVLLVEDDAAVRFGIKSYLESKNFIVRESANLHGGYFAYRDARPDAAVIDYKLPDGNALDALPVLRRIDPTVPIVLLTGHATVDLAVHAMKQGADYVLTKPVKLPDLTQVIEKVIEQRRSQNRRITDQAAGVTLPRLPDPFLGVSPVIQRLNTHAVRLAAADSTVVLYGETGSGKGVLAQWLHQNGSRAENSFVELNCATLSPEFLATELFGHNKGAFTSAVTSKGGLLETADGGTIFLDEIGDMSLQVQSMLLKVLEEKKFRRLGETASRNVDVRMITATHHDLARLVKDGRFRSDLYFRIQTVSLRVPALRERPEDIPMLAEQILMQTSHSCGGERMHLTTEAKRVLVAHSWPGNIRELRNVLERATLFATGRTISEDDLHFDALHGGSSPLPQGSTLFDSRLTLEQLERKYILTVLEQEGGHVGRAAIRLGVPRSSLYAKLRTLRAQGRHDTDAERNRA